MPFSTTDGGNSPSTVTRWIREVQENQHNTQAMNAINRLPASRQGGSGEFTHTRIRGADATPGKYTPG